MMGSGNGKGGGDLVRKTGSPAAKKNYAPQQLLGMQLGYVAIASYTDDNGKPHQNLVFVIDGEPYVAADGERWFATQLGEPKPWLAKQMRPVIAQQLAQMQQLPSSGEEPAGTAGPQETGIDVMGAPPATSASPLPVTGVDPSTRARLGGSQAR